MRHIFPYLAHPSRNHWQPMDWGLVAAGEFNIESPNGSGWFLVEHLIKMDDLGVLHFRKLPNGLESDLLYNHLQHFPQEQHHPTSKGPEWTPSWTSQGNGHLLNHQNHCAGVQGCCALRFFPTSLCGVLVFRSAPAAPSARPPPPASASS